MLVRAQVCKTFVKRFATAANTTYVQQVRLYAYDNIFLIPSVSKVTVSISNWCGT